MCIRDRYSWYNAPGIQVGDTAIGLCAATYFVRGEDSLGCVAEDTVSLNQPSQIIVSLDSSLDVSCNGLCDGEASISAIGGTGSISFLWENLDTLSSRVDLCKGDYLVYATDDGLCRDSIIVVINQPDTLKAFITDTSHIVCATVCDGAATVGQSGGTSPYTYDWFNPGGEFTNQIIGQCAGNYSVEVTDSNGCIDTAIVQINDVNLLNVIMVPTHILSLIHISEPTRPY